METQRNDMSFLVLGDIYSSIKRDDVRRALAIMLKNFRKNTGVFGWIAVYSAVCKSVKVEPVYSKEQWEQVFPFFKNICPLDTFLWRFIFDSVKTYIEEKHGHKRAS